MSLRQGAGLSGSALKWVAILTMFLDHLGATVVLELYLRQPTMALYDCYYGLRTVGRVAFPIFCFLLVEGFFHTRDRKKYALRLGLFCLLAEIPFDLAIEKTVFYPQGQNVFFTLLLGFLAIWFSWELSRRLNLHPAAATALAAIPAVAGGELLMTDYAGFGVGLIAALFVGRSLVREPGMGRGMAQLLLGSTSILVYCVMENNDIEHWAVLGLVLALLYNGQRGRGNKWFFYLFYPIHLLLLAVVCMAMA